MFSMLKSDTDADAKSVNLGAQRKEQQKNTLG